MKDVRTILDQNAFSFERLDAGDAPLRTLVQQRLSTVGPMAMLFYEQPLHIVRGQGCWLYTADGERYLDVYNNVPALGHAHPKVAEAVYQQMRMLNVHTRYLHEGIHRYIERLLATLPASLDRLVMTCTGSESNDLALRLVRQWTGKQGIIVTDGAYHGNTSAVTEVSPSAYKRGAPPDYVYQIPFTELAQQADPAAWFAQQVERGIDELEQRGYGCAALLVDTIFSSDGVFADPVGFLQPAVQRLHARGALFIADEVQPGFGRTGDALWGFLRHGLEPDVVTMGKPMGNGFPVAAVAAREELFARLNREVGYFNTFGGSTAAVAAATAVLDVLEQEQLIEHARRVGGELKHGLQQLQTTHPEIGAVRGAGLFLGLDLVDAGGEPDAARTTAVINALRQHGVLIGAAGKFGNTLKIRPPLCFGSDETAFFLQRLERALGVSGAGH